MDLVLGVHAGVYGLTSPLDRPVVDDLRALWRRAEDAGVDAISIWDHFFDPDPSTDGQCLEAISLHAALACHTSRVRCGSFVYCVGYRHPAVLANAIATIDQLSGGRAEIGLGAGWSEPEHRAYGIPFLPAGARLDRLDEAATVIRSLLTQETTTFEGTHVTMREARCEPKPVQPRLPIWIGGGGEKRTLRIAARLADGVNLPYVDPDTFRHKCGVLRSHCHDVGRDPAEVQVAVNLGVEPVGVAAEERFGSMTTRMQQGSVGGSEQEVVDRVGRYVEAGATRVNLVFRPPFELDRLEQLVVAVRKG